MALFSVMITGANRGIGLEFTRQLIKLEKPPKFIFATYRNTAKLKEIKELKEAAHPKTAVHGIKMDITKDNEILNAVKIVADLVKDNGLTLLINNAGAMKAGAFPNITQQQLDFHFNVNAIGPTLVTQAFYPLLKKASAKHETQGSSLFKAGILNLSGTSASIENAGREFLRDLAYQEYKISKTALNMAMRVIAMEAEKDNILVVMVCPGWVKTDMGTQKAEVDVNESVKNMLELMANMNENFNGCFVDRYGALIPF